jgi:8-oxo-dGTP pyrophosphatase MutT (NUDIX family)
MIYREKPEGFSSRFDVVSCFLEYDGKILLLLRQDHKPQGNTWGVPAGKVDEGESKEDSISREIFEETGYEVDGDIDFFTTLYVRYPEYDFMYHIFHHRADGKPTIKVSPNEHKAFQWVSPQDALRLPLIPDEDACIELFYGLKTASASAQSLQH